MSDYFHLQSALLPAVLGFDLHDSYWPTLSPENSEPFCVLQKTFFHVLSMLSVSELNTSPGRVPLTRRHSSTTNLVWSVYPVVPMSDDNVCLSQQKGRWFQFQRQEHWTNLPRRYVSARWALPVAMICHDCSTTWKQAGSTRVDLSARFPGIWIWRYVEWCGVRYSGWLMVIDGDCFGVFWIVLDCESVIVCDSISDLDKVHPRLANLLAKGTSEGSHANTRHPNQNAVVHVHQSFLAADSPNYSADMSEMVLWCYLRAES